MKGDGGRTLGKFFFFFFFIDQCVDLISQIDKVFLEGFARLTSIFVEVDDRNFALTRWVQEFGLAPTFISNEVVNSGIAIGHIQLFQGATVSSG
jgi:hypothetical protein